MIKRTGRFAACFMMIALAFVMCQPSVTVFSAPSSPERVIHIVYDDSGSMIVSHGKKVDTWCQAKYAMEVFAAMLGEDDLMNIYVMSDFPGGKGAKLKLNGASGAKANVEQVHSMLTAAGNTPFQTVEKAYEDLAAAKAQSKWLVVLTDGEFQNVKGTVDEYFAKKSGGVKVMYLAMGQEAGVIKENPRKNIYFEKAANNTQILQKLTGICNTIFERDKLKVDAASRIISFDIPISELIVFAQGADVDIQSVTREDGQVFRSPMEPVEVRYSEKPATNYKEFNVDKSLKGSVATFRDDFAAGRYTVNVSGAETVEVYYKPNVEIRAFLFDAEGKDVSDSPDLKKGEYTLRYGFVKAGTNDPVPESELLGDVSFSAELKTDSGMEKLQSGDKIALDVGDAELKLSAQYLKRNRLQRTYRYSIYKDKEIQFTVQEDPVFKVTASGIEGDSPVVLKATIDGAGIDGKQWETMGIPKVTAPDGGDYNIDRFRVEKSETPGSYLISPELNQDGPAGKEYGALTYQVELEEEHGRERWSGSTEQTMRFSEERSWFDIYKKLIYRLINWLILLLLILGYIPPFKKYLPRRLVREPVVETRMLPKKGSLLQGKRFYEKGRVSRGFCSTIIPYFPQHGTIIYVPYSERGRATSLRVRAIKSRKMKVLNIEDFRKKKNITFDDEYVGEDDKYLHISSGTTICLKSDKVKYTCNLNQSEE